MKSRDETGGILVSGGSGFIGRYLVKRLSEKKETIVNLYHNRLPEPMPKVYPVCSDLSLSELLLAPLRGIDTVFHLAWQGTFADNPDSTSWALNRDQLPANAKMTLNLIEAMEQSKAQRIIFLSVMGADKSAGSSFLREKYLSELLVLNSKIPEKIILRTSLVIGEGGPSDRLIQSILQMMRWPALYPVPFAKQQIAPIFLPQLVEALVHYSRAPMQQAAMICELAGPHPVRVDELFALVNQKFMSGQRKFPLKGFIGNRLCKILEWERQKGGESQPRLRDMLTIASQPKEVVNINNPLVDELPKPKKMPASFGEAWPKAFSSDAKF